jgi:hypothetical protein
MCLFLFTSEADVKENRRSLAMNIIRVPIIAVSSVQMELPFSIFLRPFSFFIFFCNFFRRKKGNKWHTVNKRAFNESRLLSVDGGRYLTSPW